MPKNSFLALMIIQEYKRIKARYCVDYQYMKDGRCELKKDIKQCYKKNNKIRR